MTDESLWKLAELEAHAAEALAASTYRPPDNGQVKAIPDRRTIRYYRSRGLLDEPSEVRGRTAYYGRRHLLQLVAIKQLQAQGRSLAEIGERLAGCSVEELETLARLPQPLGTEVEAGHAAPAVAAVPPASLQAQTPDLPATLSTGVSLAPGVTVLMQTPRPLTGEDWQAIQRTAAPLVNLLRARSLISGPSQGSAAGVAAAPTEPGAPTTQQRIRTAAGATGTPADQAVVGWLVPTDGAHRGEPFELHAGNNVIGSASGCDVTLADAGIAPVHAYLSYRRLRGRYRFLLTNLDPRAGTYVGDEQTPISCEELRDSDVVVFGRTPCLFKSLPFLERRKKKAPEDEPAAEPTEALVPERQGTLQDRTERLLATASKLPLTSWEFAADLRLFTEPGDSPRKLAAMARLLSRLRFEELRRFELMVLMRICEWLPRLVPAPIYRKLEPMCWRAEWLRDQQPTNWAGFRRVAADLATHLAAQDLPAWDLN